MKKFIIQSNYKYEIEADSAGEALEIWNEIIEDLLDTQNKSLLSEFVESLEAKEKIHE